MNYLKSKLRLRLIASVLCLVTIFTLSTTAVSVNASTVGNNIENTAHINYERLLSESDSNADLISMFNEMYGDLSAEYILSNYTSLFGVGEDEIDEAFLNIITRDKIKAGEDVRIQAPSHLAHSIITDSEKQIEQTDIFEYADIPKVTYAEYNEVESDPTDVFDALLDLQSKHGQTVATRSAIDMQEQTTLTRASGNNSFVDLTFVNKTDNSVTMNVWYKTSGDTNAILQQYDYYDKTWTYIRGRDGKPAGTNGNVTVSNLKTGANYRFRAGFYDRGSTSWKYAEIEVQTSGLKPPSFSVTNIGTNSVTLNAQFPSEYLWGNRIKLWDGYNSIDWYDGTSYEDNYVKSGTYTINNQNPGCRLQIQFSYRDPATNEWRNVNSNITTTLPPEQYNTYNYSNMTFKFEKHYTNYAGSALMNSMMQKMNNGYNVFHDLVGGPNPVSGVMKMEHDRSLVGTIWEGMSGNPISLNVGYSMEHLGLQKKRNVVLTEVPFHEMSHNFDSWKWEFEPEALANLKVHYYLKTTGETFAVRGKENIVGADAYKQYIKSVANRMGGETNYDANIPYGSYSGYSLAYNLVNIADTIGYQAFKDTFGYFHDLPANEVPNTKIGKFNLFMTKLMDFSGVDVISMFNAQEKQVYQTELGGTINYIDLYPAEEGGPTEDERIHHFYIDVFGSNESVETSTDDEEEKSQKRVSDDSPAIEEETLRINRSQSGDEQLQGTVRVLIQYRPSEKKLRFMANVDEFNHLFFKPEITKLTFMLETADTEDGAYTSADNKTWDNCSYIANYAIDLPAKTKYYKYTVQLWFDGTKVELLDGGVGIWLVNRTGHIWQSEWEYQDVLSSKNVTAPPANYTKGAIVDRRFDYRVYYKNEYGRRYATSLNLSGYEVHHLKPIEYGGDHSFDNLIHIPKNIHKKISSWFTGY